MAIKAITLDDGTTIYIQADESSQDLSNLIQKSEQPDYTPSDLPDGAEATGLIEDMIIGSKMLRETIEGTAKTVRESLSALKPDEVEVELNIGFESNDKTLISYIAKGEGSVKITAKWKS